LVFACKDSDFKYEDTLDVWGYGKYGAPCYVYDGVIEMTSDGSISSSEYMTILVKFPKDTFNLDITLDKTFDEFLNMANEGATNYSGNHNDYDNYNDIYAYVATKNVNLRKAFYMALGRERYGMYKSN